MTTRRLLTAILALSTVGTGAALAQQPTTPQSATSQPPPKTAAPRSPQAAAGPSIPGGVKVPDDYIIGADDVLTILFWREKDLSADVVVRPDGKITLPLINDVLAAGLTTEQLREKLTAEATRFIEDPSATVVLKEIRSRKVFITGEVGKPGPYIVTGDTTVLQLISMAGGLQEYAKRKDIVIMRTENGKQLTLPFDYTAIGRKGSKVNQNIVLKPGDVVVVP